MRKFITFILIFVSIFTFGQDREMFDYINTYRVKNGVKKIKWSNDLYEISKTHNDSIVSKDSLYHSGTDTYENCAGSSKWTTSITPSRLKDFNKFINKYYGLTFDPKSTTDVDKFIKLSVIYAWTISVNHNKIMLKKDLKWGSIETHISDVTFVDNVVVKYGKTIKFSNISPYYKVKVYTTFNMLDY